MNERGIGSVAGRPRRQKSLPLVGFPCQELSTVPHRSYGRGIITPLKALATVDVPIRQSNATCDTSDPSKANATTISFVLSVSRAIDEVILNAEGAGKGVRNRQLDSAPATKSVRGHQVKFLEAHLSVKPAPPHAGVFGLERHSPIMCIGNGIPGLVGRFAEQGVNGTMCVISGFSIGWGMSHLIVEVR